ncbi:MAG: plasmid stabilization protein [Rhodospirillaceae bacterium]|nr:plasmid stabilization protein [Rhodospirillaceae bacterium]MYB12230.1 plasmid stabilization protein [Rhodospirillaceae bacterium]MYI48172.1 plasmid stabilization protein [Rhodospirillaceae bacterium]
MATMIVKNLPNGVYRRIKSMAADRGVSAEALVREILDEATRPAERLGDVIAAHVREAGVDFPEIVRSKEPIGRDWQR